MGGAGEEVEAAPPQVGQHCEPTGPAAAAVAAEAAAAVAEVVALEHEVWLAAAVVVGRQVEPGVAWEAARAQRPHGEFGTVLLGGSIAGLLRRSLGRGS